MRYIAIAFIFFLSGCDKSEKLDAKDYVEIGKFDKAEEYYQDLILLEKNQSVKELWKEQLLELYLGTDQLDKADRYMVYFVAGSADQSIKQEMIKNHNKVAKALYDSKRYRRAFFHYNKSLEFTKKRNSRIELSDFPDLCDIDLITTAANAARAARAAGLENELLELSQEFRPIITSKNCSNDLIAKHQLDIFPEIMKINGMYYWDDK
jgi:tetratricopeptide (TPR) repeat protein